MTAEMHRTEPRNTVEVSQPAPDLAVSWLLRRAVLGPEEQHLGHVRDVVVSSGEYRHPPVTGVVALLGGCEMFLPTAALVCRQPERIQLADAAKLRRFVHRAEDLLLGAEVLGRRLRTVAQRRPVRAHDFLLSRSVEGWVLSGVVVRNRLHRRFRPGEHGGLLDWKAVRMH